MDEADLCFSPASELAGLVRERKLSCAELIDTYLARIDALNPRLNAYITVAHDSARADAAAADALVAGGAALGPLHGLPVAIKDLLHTAGLRTTGGSRVYEHFIPGRDAVAVARLKAAGAIVIGKTNTPEFGHKSTTENLLLGPTCNPWDVTKTAGGSSGGAGAATAAGLAPLSIGTDAGGSIRTPASFCGVFGLKPSFGLVPGGPSFGGGRSIAHTGPITRTVADAALLLDIVARPSEADRLSVPAPATGAFSEALHHLPGELRIGWSPDLGYAPVDPEVARITSDAVAKFAACGWQVDTADPGFSDPIEPFNLIIRAENHIAAAYLLDDDPAALDPGMRAFTENGADISARDYLAANAARDTLCASLAAYFENHDVLVTPALAVPPLDLGTRPQHIGGRPIHSMSWLGFTYPFNLSGNPAATVPCGFTQGGLPVGLQIVGPRYADARVLQVCAGFERVAPWATGRPPLGRN